MFPLRLVNKSFNTQPPEGGWGFRFCVHYHMVGFNTQPPEGGWAENAKKLGIEKEFQHTAARRRLARSAGSKTPEIVVSTHSRPKAAGR